MPLLILGDSVLKGIMNDDGRYRLCAGHDFAFLGAKNASKMGATIEYALTKLEKEPPSPGTTVLLSFGGNDCDYSWMSVAAAPEAEHLPHIEPERFVSLYRKAVGTVRAAGAEAVMASIAPIDSERYFTYFSRNLDADAILRWLGDLSRLYRWQEYYNSLAASLARELDCRFVDVRSAFLRQPDLSPLFGIDGIHPTQKGHDLIHAVIREAKL